MRRSIDVYDYDAPKHFEFLEDFLGSNEICRSIERVRRTFQFEKNNPVYLRYWVQPNSTFWIGIEQARSYLSKGVSFAGTLTEEMKRPIELSSKLQIFSQTMPSNLQNEFRGRILSTDYLAPVLFEVDTAAHFWQLGYEIQWYEPSSSKGSRIPEFSAHSSDFSFEVECKAKEAHSGRHIVRPTFYRLVDAIGRRLFDQGFIGHIEIGLSGRMPLSDEWRNECVSEISSVVDAGGSECTLADGTQIALNVFKIGAISVPTFDLVATLRRLRTPYANIAVFAKDYDGIPTNSLVVKAESNSKDEYLLGIFEELLDANRQPSGQLPALLCCLVPEIPSFEGLGEKSALANMTYTFFEDHARPYIFAVTYTSDTVIETERIAISRSFPSITFSNHKYDEAFGDPPSTYAVFE